MPSNPPRSPGFWGFVLAITVSGSLFIWGQDSSTQLSPRELFYREQASARTRLPAGSSKSQTAAKSTAPPKDTTSSSTTTMATAQTGGAKGNALLTETSTTTKANPEVSHLGLRYSLLLVDQTSGEGKAVNSNQTFDQGQCFGLEFQTNRSGYLYVFNLGSSGTWKALLPTEKMPEEGNFVPAYTTMRVPASHCYRISGPPGTEHLFVVMSRNPQDVNELNRSIRDGYSGGAKPSPSTEPNAALATMASKLNQALQKLASLKGRDLEVEEVGGTKNFAEATPAVYVVHTSDTPSDKVVTELQIIHR